MMNGMMNGMMDKNLRLILASSSPRRRELMSAAGYAFEVIVPSETAECGICSRETPPELVTRLAFQKAKDVVERVEDGIVIGCDTVAECQGQVLGKPANRKHAEEMLKLMSGRPHRVLSGLCVWDVTTAKRLLEVEVTKLQMERFDETVLQDYLDTEQWEGKAGAFGFQDGLDWVRIVEGNESNVVGLPMERLARMLAQLKPS